jgi:histidyl-tRNA synthetase
MKVADRAGARYTILLGAREAERGAVGVRDMRSHEQIEVPRELVAGWVQERLEAEDSTQ